MSQFLHRGPAGSAVTYKYVLSRPSNRPKLERSLVRFSKSSVDFKNVSALALSRFTSPCPDFESSNFPHVPCSIRWKWTEPFARTEPRSLVPIASHCHRAQRLSPRRGRNDVKYAPGVDRASMMAGFGLRDGETKSDGLETTRLYGAAMGARGSVLSGIPLQLPFGAGTAPHQGRSISEKSALRRSTSGTSSLREFAHVTIGGKRSRRSPIKAAGGACSAGPTATDVTFNLDADTGLHGSEAGLVAGDAPGSIGLQDSDAQQVERRSNEQGLEFRHGPARRDSVSDSGLQIRIQASRLHQHPHHAPHTGIRL